jgi:hypothetical protein
MPELNEITELTNRIIKLLENNNIITDSRINKDLSYSDTDMDNDVFNLLNLNPEIVYENVMLTKEQKEMEFLVKKFLETT